MHALRPITIGLVGLLVLAASVSTATIAARPAASTLECSTVPLGTANLPDESEPTEPIWCLPDGSLTQAPLTGSGDGLGGWVDSFSNGVSGASPAHFHNELGYTTQDSISADSTTLTQHWLGNGYFVTDMAKTATFNGSDLSPNMAVHFENGELVLEADVAASEPGFVDSNGGDVVWAEVVWSASQMLDPTNTTDALYSYGYHRGSWTGGCRIQASRSLTCAVEADHDLATTTNDQAPCYSSPPARVMELSGHQKCGDVHSGFSVSFGAPSSAWRLCPPGTVDPCLDRFRFEWSKTGLVAYVNGIEFARDTGWPSQAQLPDTVVNGLTPIFAHYVDWGDFKSSDSYRFHWQRIAAQPHNADGTLASPSASPTFGASPPPSPVPTPSNTPSPAPSVLPTPFSCNLRFGNANHPGTCLAAADGSVVWRPA